MHHALALFDRLDEGMTSRSSGDRDVPSRSFESPMTERRILSRLSLEGIDQKSVGVLQLRLVASSSKDD